MDANLEMTSMTWANYLCLQSSTDCDQYLGNLHTEIGGSVTIRSLCIHNGEKLNIADDPLHLDRRMP